MQRGIFITIEGVEGAGKSTLIAALRQALVNQGRTVTVTREPGATKLGQSLRDLLLRPDRGPIAPSAELCLFAADRAQHITEVIRPALARGEVVLCDRYVHSTFAYQGYARGLPLVDIEGVMRFATGGLLPERVLLLDLDPEIGLRRVRSRQAQGEVDAIEKEALDFHVKVRDGFLTMARDAANRFVVLDATASPEGIAARALESLSALM